MPCFPNQRRNRRPVFSRMFRSGKEQGFRELVQSHHFRKISYQMEQKSNPENVKYLYEGLNQQSPLHFILPHKPPLELVEQIIRFTSGSCLVPEEALDADGRTPLHIAAEHNCSFEIIERLLSGDSLVIPALTKDRYDRYPLHWACCHQAASGRLGNDNKFDTVLLLLNAFPQAVNMKDIDNRSPKDYAIHRALDIRIVEVLKRVSARQQAQEGGFPFQKGDASPGGNHDLGSLKSTVEFPSKAFTASTTSTMMMQSLSGASQYFFNRDFFPQPQPSEDDISSLGWDRGSSVAPSPSRQSSLEIANSKSFLSPSKSGSPSPQKVKSLLAGTPEGPEEKEEFPPLESTSRTEFSPLFLQSTSLVTGQVGPAPVLTPPKTNDGRHDDEWISLN